MPALKILIMKSVAVGRACLPVGKSPRTTLFTVRLREVTNPGRGDLTGQVAMPALKILIMKSFVSLILFVLFASAMFAQKADIIIINGKITTLDDRNTEAQAVAITANKITLTGTNEQVLKLKGKQTKLVDAKGNRVYPVCSTVTCM